jgi:hypothetical protein
MVHRTHKLSSELLEMRLFDVDEAIFHGVERPLEDIFYILEFKKAI